MAMENTRTELPISAALQSKLEAFVSTLSADELAELERVSVDTEVSGYQAAQLAASGIKYAANAVGFGTDLINQGLVAIATNGGKYNPIKAV